MNYDKPDSNIPKSIDQYEGNTDSTSPFSALGNVIDQSNHVENSTDSKKLLITNNKILNVISKIQQDIYDEQDTSIKKIDYKGEKEETKSVQNIITNMFIENGDTDFNFIGRRRYIPSKDTEEKKRKKEEEKKKEAAQKKRNKTQDKINTENDKKHDKTLKRQKSQNRKTAALAGLLGLVSAIEIAELSLLGAATGGASLFAAAGIAAELTFVGNIIANQWDAAIDEAGGNSQNMGLMSKISFGMGDDEEQKSTVEFNNLVNEKVIQENLLEKDTITNWYAIGELDDDQLKRLSKNQRFSIDDRAKFLFLADLYSKGNEKKFTQFIYNNAKNVGTETSAPKIYKENVLQNEKVVKRKSLSVNAQAAFKFFVARGYTEAGAAGIVSNLMTESGEYIDPHRVNMDPREDIKEGKGSHGIAQWNKKRRIALFEFAGVEYVDENSIRKIPLEKQLQFLDYELNTTYKEVSTKLKDKATTPAEASQFFMDKFEKPENNIQPQRISDADYVIKYFDDKNQADEIKKEQEKKPDGKDNGKGNYKKETYPNPAETGLISKNDIIETGITDEKGNPIIIDTKQMIASVYDDANKNEKVKTAAELIIKEYSKVAHEDIKKSTNVEIEKIKVNDEIEKTYVAKSEVSEDQNNTLNGEIINQMAQFMNNNNSNQNTNIALAVNNNDKLVAPLQYFG